MYKVLSISTDLFFCICESKPLFGCGLLLGDCLDLKSALCLPNNDQTVELDKLI